MAKHIFARLKGILTGAKAGTGEDVPLLETELTRLEHFAHFWVHVAQSFVRNRCLVHASALSFSTLLALIPMLAVVIGVTSSLLKSQGEAEIYAAVNRFVASIVPPVAVGDSQHPAAASNTADAALMTPLTNAVTALTSNVVATVTNSLAATNEPAAGTATPEDIRVVSAQREAARSIHQFVQNSSSTTLGVLGMLILVWVAISMLTNIEATFNDIWGVIRGRPWFWRIVLYWGTLTLGPLALIGAYSLGGAHLAAARQFITQMPFVGDFLFETLPLAILGLVFALIYLAVPNTKVRWSSALVGGFVAGLLWHLNNVLGYLYVSRFASTHMIYGSLFLVPVFMIGLYTSWVILLFGVQVSYAWQNRKSYLQDKFAENVNQRGREFIALRLMTCLGLRYENGQPPATVKQIAGELGLSTRLTQQVLQTLLTARLISEITGCEAAYCPARPLEAINAHQVLLAVRSINRPVVFAREEPVRDEIYGEFARIEEAERVAAASVTMQALVHRARAKLTSPTLVLPETVAEGMMSEAIEMVEHPVIPPPELAVEEVKSASPTPEKPVRRIVVPEDNHDFPL